MLKSKLRGGNQKTECSGIAITAGTVHTLTAAARTLQRWVPHPRRTESAATVRVTAARQNHPATDVYPTFTQLNTGLFFFKLMIYLYFNIESQRMKIKVAFPSKSDYASSFLFLPTHSSYKFDFLSHLHFS